MSVPTHDHHFRRLLNAFASDHMASQRSLAKELGIALGLTNLLIKRLVRKGWVRVIKIKPNRVAYLITPAGIIEKARLSRDYFDYSVEFYRETRNRIRATFAELSQNWPLPDPGTPKRVVFYGAGEVAEIGYVCLADMDLLLAGVVDDERRKPFFGMPVRSPEELDGMTIAGEPFDRLIVMSFADPEVSRSQLAAAIGQRMALDRVTWL